jgi:NADPH:quinone reductase-like Zn-dependent oxidoreductase
LFIRQQGRGFVSTSNPEDLAALKELAEAGHITPVIDRTYPLSRAPEAVAHVGAGHTRGKTIITMAETTN